MASHIKPHILAFSGPIASGKTTISRELARVLGWKYGSFGDFVRKEAIKRGINHESRMALQEVGSALINQGWEQFCLGVLADANWRIGDGLVLDGIRHIESLETIREIVHPLKVSLIFINVAPEIRVIRLAKRGIGGNLSGIENHSTERQVMKELLERADLLIDGFQPLNEIVIKVHKWLERNS